MTKKNVRGTTMADKLNATSGTTLPEQELQPQSVPRVFSRFGQRRPPTRPYAISELGSSQLQSFNTSLASDSLEGGPPISQGVSNTSSLLHMSDDNLFDLLGITSHPILGTSSLSQTTGTTSIPQEINATFSCQIAHGTSNSIGVGTKVTNANSLPGSSKQFVGNGLGIIPNAVEMGPMVIGSQDNINPSTQVSSEPNSDVPNTLTTANPKKRGRGPSKCPNPEPGTKYILQFNEEMQPIGPDRKEFMKYLSKLARNSEILPLTYAAWNNIPQNTLDAIWDDIQAIAICPPAYKNNCMKSLDEKWRSWKSYLKRKFFTSKSKEEALANVPTRVQPEHWKILVQYWSLEEVQTIADQNKKNRAMHGPAHRTGRTPHAVIRQEMKEKGLDTDQLSVYIRTRTDPNGVPKDDEAATVIGQFREKLSQIPISEQTTDVKQRIFREVMGSECRGYVRTVGLGPSPSQYFDKTSSKLQFSDEYMTLILNKVDNFYEQKYGQKILHMQSQIDSLNARLQSNGCITVPSSQMAYTQGVHQVRAALGEHDQGKHLSQILNSGDVRAMETDNDEDNEDSE